ncbi:MAG: cation:proton antiporter [Halosimplex sp.]
MAELFATVVGVLLLLSVAVVVRAIAAETNETVYPVLLVVTGIAVSVLGLDPGFRLSSNFVLMVLVPTVLFQGAQRTKSSVFLRVLPVSLIIPIFGLPIAVALLGVLGSALFDLPLVATLLFAVIIYPVDPVAIVAFFREVDAPERLGVIAELESHFSDGFAVVTFGVLLELVAERYTTGDELAGVLTVGDLAGVAVEITVVSFGGALVGAAVGGVALSVLRVLDDRMAELLVTVLAAYGSFLFADHVLHVSGVVSTVATGLVIGVLAGELAVETANLAFIERTWDAAAFLVVTIVLVLIALQAPWRRLLWNAPLVLGATALVLLVRAVVIYGVTNAASITGIEPVPFRFQHVLVWGGMHTVIPIALLLSVPRKYAFREDLVVLVFGVAFVGIVGQGLLFPLALRLTGVTEESDAEPVGRQ